MSSPSLFLFYFLLMIFIKFSLYETSSDFLVYTIFQCVGVGLSILMSIYYRLGRYFFRRKIEKTRHMEREIDGKVFFSRQFGRVFFQTVYLKYCFPICTLSWRVINYLSRQGNCINRRNESTIFIITKKVFGILE